MSPAALATCNPNEAGVAPVTPPPSPMDKAHQMFGAPVAHSVLWNAMIHPFLNMTIYGAAWYQGESNANAPSTPASIGVASCWQAVSDAVARASRRAMHSQTRTTARSPP